MNRTEILTIINYILIKQNKPEISSEKQSLREVGFRSLDFSELALRIEKKINKELSFNAGKMRSVKSIEDLISFFADITNETN